MAQPLLKLDGVSKSYGSVQANKDIDLALEGGEIHAVFGENGAGKSTLAGIICGVVRPDNGRIFWEGQQTMLDSPAKSRKMGIRAVFQNFSLFDSLSVLDNVALGLPHLPRSELIEKIREISGRFDLEIDLHRSLSSMSVGEWQRVEIIRCLLGDAKLLILDEPTSVLTFQEAEKLFDVLRRAAAAGSAILYISHRLDEIRKLCSKATVMRQGEVVASCDPRKESSSSLAEMMIGSLPPSRRSLRSTKREKRSEAPSLLLENVNVKADSVYSTELKDVSLALEAGTITGIAGVAGNGQSELYSVISGERRLRASEGRLVLEGKSIGMLSTSARRRNGMNFIPEQRLGHSVVGSLNLWENGCFTSRDVPGSKIVRSGFISGASAKRFSDSIIKNFKVLCQSANAKMHSLSGGNQQKFVLGRELLQNPRVLVVEQPTWGVDVGSAALIHQSLIELAEGGAAVLVISQDLDEIFMLAEQVAVINSGRLSETISVDELDAARLGLMMADEKEAMRAAA